MKKRKYDPGIPRKMYSYFVGYSGAGAPSMLKFAVTIGATLSDLERWKRHPNFMHAYSECSEIRRDYLIDNALTKKLDASVTRFILASEYGMGESSLKEEDKKLEVTLEVLGE